MNSVKVYGASWCHDTRNTLAHLRDANVPLEFIDVDESIQAQEWVLRQNDGKQKLPTVDLGGLVLSVPSNGQLDAALKARGMMA
jgi:glutaredoxin